MLFGPRTMRAADTQDGVAGSRRRTINPLTVQSEHLRVRLLGLRTGGKEWWKFRAVVGCLRSMASGHAAYANLE